MAPCRVPGPEWVRGASIREAVVEVMVARAHVIQGGTDQMHKYTKNKRSQVSHCWSYKYQKLE